jgi:hypothetical protein
MVEKLNNQQLLQIENARNYIRTFGKFYLLQNNIFGVGVGFKKIKDVNTEEIAIKFFIEKKIQKELISSSKILPQIVIFNEKDILCDVDEMDVPSAPHQETGIFRDNYKSFTKKEKKMIGITIQPGNSISSIFTSAGTTCLCLNRKGEVYREFKYLLSCNHVLANFNVLKIGTPIIQPSLRDGGFFPKSFCGNLIDYLPLQFGASNYNFADAGVAYLPSSMLTNNHIIGIGRINSLGQINNLLANPLVKKVGSASGITSGSVQAIYSMLKINYWALGNIGKNTIFSDQIVTTLMGAYGDSGSLLFNYENMAFGMLFAGSSTHTFFNPLEPIFDYFSLEF